MKVVFDLDGTLALTEHRAHFLEQSGCGWWFPAVTSLLGPRRLISGDRQDSPYKAKKEAARLLALGKDAT